MKTSWTLLILLLISTIGQGCQTVRLNNVKELTEHPQFPDAARAAPAWTKAALRKVAELEHRIERKMNSYAPVKKKKGGKKKSL